MNESTNFKANVSSSRDEEENEISIVELFWKYVRYWKWILLGVLVSIFVAGVYLYYSTPVYRITSSIILKDMQSTKKIIFIAGHTGRTGFVGNCEQCGR
jgi:uncharacterized protein involved in exopolysaccharide biosynthesis